jgi:hypothetical protein
MATDHFLALNDGLVASIRWVKDPSGDRDSMMPVCDVYTPPAAPGQPPGYTQLDAGQMRAIGAFFTRYFAVMDEGRAKTIKAEDHLENCPMREEHGHDDTNPCPECKEAHEWLS